LPEKPALSFLRDALWLLCGYLCNNTEVHREGTEVHRDFLKKFLFFKKENVFLRLKSWKPFWVVDDLKKFFWDSVKRLKFLSMKIRNFLYLLVQSRISAAEMRTYLFDCTGFLIPHRRISKSAVLFYRSL